MKYCAKRPSSKVSLTTRLGLNGLATSEIRDALNEFECDDLLRRLKGQRYMPACESAGAHNIDECTIAFLQTLSREEANWLSDNYHCEQSGWPTISRLTDHLHIRREAVKVEFMANRSTKIVYDPTEGPIPRHLLPEAPTKLRTSVVQRPDLTKAGAATPATRDQLHSWYYLISAITGLAEVPQSLVELVQREHGRRNSESEPSLGSIESVLSACEDEGIFGLQS